MNPDDPFALSRFLEAQEPVKETVTAELRRGRKESHWMWFVFPQMAGLGFSPTAQFFAIQSRDEAVAFLAHPILGPRTVQWVELLLLHLGKTAAEMFGYPDDLKLRSSLTLFAEVSPAGSVFHQALGGFFQGQPDPATLRLLAASPQ